MVIYAIFDSLFLCEFFQFGRHDEVTKNIEVSRVRNCFKLSQTVFISSSFVSVSTTAEIDKKVGIHTVLFSRPFPPQACVDS